jgi:hypothetical protein
LLISDPSVAKGFTGGSYDIQQTMSAAFASLREWMRGPRERPLLLGPSLLDVYPVTAPDEDASGALANALRRSADAIVNLQRSVVDAGAELIVAPTAGTTAPALHATGQAYRAAALTAAAVDLTRDGVLAAGRSAAVIGEVPAHEGSRAKSEAITHIERLATSAIDGVLILAHDPHTAEEIVDRAVEHRLPALVEIDVERTRTLSSVPAGSTIVVRGSDVEKIVRAITELRQTFPMTPLGARFVAPDRDPQLAIAQAWASFAGLSLAVVGVAGHAALTALPALVDLSRAPRVSVV